MSLSRLMDFTSVMGCMVDAFVWDLPGALPAFGTISSAYVFHSPHEGQRPIHFEDFAPHCWQINSDFDLAFCRPKDFIVDISSGKTLYKWQDNNFPTNFHHDLVFG